MQTIAVHAPHVAVYPLLALSAVLTLLLLCGVVVHSDITQRRIPNVYCAAVAMLAPLWWIGQGGWPGLINFAGHLVIPLLVSGPLLVLFALRVFAGGDVKLLLALLLWVPAANVATMLILMVLAGGLLGVVLIVSRRIFAAVNGVTVPYGVPIIVAALIVLVPSFRDALGS